jgi:hypothetical protein
VWHRIGIDCRVAGRRSLDNRSVKAVGITGITPFCMHRGAMSHDNVMKWESTTDTWGFETRGPCSHDCSGWPNDTIWFDASSWTGSCNQPTTTWSSSA